MQVTFECFFWPCVLLYVWFFLASFWTCVKALSRVFPITIFCSFQSIKKSLSLCAGMIDVASACAIIKKLVQFFFEKWFFMCLFTVSSFDILPNLNQFLTYFKFNFCKHMLFFSCGCVFFSPNSSATIVELCFTLFLFSFIS